MAKEVLNSEMLGPMELFGRDEVQTFLDTQEHRDDAVLGPVLKLIKKLSPGGGLWPEGKLWSVSKDPREAQDLPDQLIYRQRAVPKTKEFCDLLEKEFRGIGYWNLWSLLGLFLSLKYTGNSTSTKRKFFARLTCMYGWWCMSLAPDIGSRIQPSTYQCTWLIPNPAGGTYDFFLGHSYGGPSGTEAWKTAVKKARCKLLDPVYELSPEKLGWDMAPNLGVDGKVGTQFGNCAETYAFLSFMFENQRERRGYAVNRPYFKSKVYDEKKAYEKGLDPCDNCKLLLNILGDDATKYAIGFEWDDGDQQESI